jgi:hypothetical protein
MTHVLRLGAEPDAESVPARSVLRFRQIALASDAIAWKLARSVAMR